MVYNPTIAECQRKSLRLTQGLGRQIPGKPEIEYGAAGL